MDEPSQNEDIALDAEQTQATAEIIAALSQNSTNSIKTEADLDGPTSEFEALLISLSENPHDTDGWKRLIDLANNSGELAKIQKAYEELLKHYPNTSSAQIAYINHYLKDETMFPEAEQLFIKFLRSSPNVDLWKFYLSYVRRRNTGPSKRETVRKSYDFALTHIGQDKDAGEIHSDYIQFLKAGETSSTWEEQQKMDALRKAYHKAVQIPLDNVERLWSELETFETSLNKITAKKFMSDLSPAHMQARTVLRQLTNYLNGLYPPNQGSEIWLPSLPKFDPADRALVGKWKVYLKWEESNPLEIEEKDRQTLVTRIQGVYRKAVIRMRFYPEIWYMAYIWTSAALPQKQDEALLILKAGLEANPSSYLLNFTYAEVMELKSDFPEVHSTYEKFIAVLGKGLDELEKNGPANGVKDEPNSSQSTNDSFNSQSSDDRNAKKEPTEAQLRRSEYGLAYIMWMRFARRAEGLQSLRKIFAKARKDRWAPWEVYEASALMEYHCFDDKTVATRIFEKGLDLFGDEIEYVCRYLGFLLSVNDSNNARALFERVIPSFPEERGGRELWERWARYEYQYGDLEGSLRLEKRWAEAFPKDPPIKRFAQRYTYLKVDAIANRDIGVAVTKRNNARSSAPLGKTETFGSLGGNASTKRPASPDHRVKREDNRNFNESGGSGYKRQRGNASPARDRDVPMRDRDRDHRDRDGRDRWGDNRGGRRFSPAPPTSGQSWDSKDRDRDDRDGGRGYGAGGREIKKEESFRGGPPQAQVPPIVSWFIGELPPAASFDGPIFKTEDLMKCFKNAIIPSTGAGGATGGPPPRARSPLQAGSSGYNQHHRGGGRPPPDYGPYQGPGGGGGGGGSGRGRRY